MCILQEKGINTHTQPILIQLNLENDCFTNSQIIWICHNCSDLIAADAVGRWNSSEMGNLFCHFWQSETPWRNTFFSSICISKYSTYYISSYSKNRILSEFADTQEINTCPISAVEYHVNNAILLLAFRQEKIQHHE